MCVKFVDGLDLRYTCNINTMQMINGNWRVNTANLDMRLRTCLMIGLMHDFCIGEVTLDTKKGNFANTALILKNIIKLKKSRTTLMLKEYYVSSRTTLKSLAKMMSNGNISPISHPSPAEFPMDSFQAMADAFKVLSSFLDTIYCIGIIFKCTDVIIHHIFYTPYVIIGNVRPNYY